MTASLLPVPKARFFDASGAPLANGKVYAYAGGTTTPKDTYLSSVVDPGNKNTNPVILNAAGEANIWLDGNYKIKLTNSAGAEQWTVDNIQSISALFASPAFTGTPTAPTAAPGTNTTQIATTAFVTNAVDDFETLINEIDVFIIGGQSNAVGQGTSGPTPPSGAVLQYYNGALSNAADPVGNAGTGSAWPAFGMYYYNATGRKVCVVPVAVDGSAQCAAADTGSGNWDASGTLYGLSVTAGDAAIAALTAAGYTPIYKGVLWDQGETDGGAIYNSTITPSQYTTAYQAMAVRYRAHYGATMPIYMFQVGANSPDTYAQIRAIQEALEVADPYTFIVFRDGVYFPTWGYLNVDNVHYNQTGLNYMGQQGAANVVSALSNRIRQYVEAEAYGVETVFTGKRASGTRTSPIAVSVNQQIAEFGGVAFNGTSYPIANAGGVRVVAAQDQTATHGGSYLQFFRTPIDSIVPAAIGSWGNLDSGFNIFDTIDGATNAGSLFTLGGIGATKSIVSITGIGVGVNRASTTFASIAAGTTAKSSFNLGTGVAPTSPVAGDFWFDGTSLKYRNGAGVTKTLTGS